MHHNLLSLLLVTSLAFSFSWNALPGALLPSGHKDAAFAPVPQAKVTVEDLGISYQFGEQITFRARIESDAPIREVLLFVTPHGQDAIMQRVMPTESVTAPEAGQPLDIQHAIDVSQLPLRPFTDNAFHYIITLEDGTVIPSTSFSFRYEDTRFPWQSLINTDFEVYWYGRDAAFAQDILNVARSGMEKMSDILTVDPPAPIRIYAYDASQDLQTALNLNQSWIVGHAAPDLGQMYIYIPKGPEQRLEIERQVPHEIMHFLQYQFTDETLRRQPVWLVEGMASLAELYPNPEYYRVLTAMTASRELLPMASLCTAFPREASGAFQAYAQSESFVRLIHQYYGRSGLMKLMEQYNNGQGCEEGFSSALGVSLAQFEYRWKQEILGIDTGSLAFRNLSPYLLIFVLVAAPITLAFLPKPKTGKAQGAPKS